MKSLVSFMRNRQKPVVIVLAVVVLCWALGGVNYVAQRGQFEATSRVALAVSKPPTVKYQLFAAAPALTFMRGVPSYSSLAYTDNFLRRVIDNNEFDVSVEGLRNGLTVTSPQLTSIVDFTVRAQNGHLAARISDAVASEFIDALPQLENPTPVTGILLPAVVQREVFPHAFWRNFTLSSLAALLILYIIHSFLAGRRNFTSESKLKIPRASTTTKQ
jgi:capsular polysaccharide biosynthesis protein